MELATAESVRVCSACQQPRALSQFGVYRINGREHRRQTCNACRREQEAQRYRDNPEVQARAKRAARLYHVRATYGLDSAAYAGLLEAHDGKCGICRGELNQPHIDHDHATGAIRGLLCGPCNRAIGLMKDDPARLRAAAIYLEEKKWMH